MAALGDAALGRPRYPACVPYSIPYPCPPAAKGKGKGAAGGGCPPAASSSSSSAGAASSSFPGYAQLTAAEYFDSYQRAQLIALLSQVSPGFTLRPRRASSRDVAVQVNPRRDVSVQCSLGRRTLLRRARRPGPGPGPGPEGSAGVGGGGSASPQPARRGPEQGSSPRGAPRPVRFPRTVAVYSPVACRRLTTYLEGAEPAAGEQRSGAPEGERGPPPPRPRGPEEGDVLARKAPQRLLSEEEEDEAQAAVLASWEPVDGPGLQPRVARGGEAAQGRAPGHSEHPPLAGRTQDAAGERLSSRSPESGKERLRFQFLEQKYGYYHCKDCKIRWESAYVWCVQGTNKVMLMWYMSCSYERGKLTLALCMHFTQTEMKIRKSRNSIGWKLTGNKAKCHCVKKGKCVPSACGRVSGWP
ncbi:zygote arrest protein 1 isoform X4 [Manis pentadactyla]|uniref:zygote arrest protein 1 isoform X4 n=1 Tax=Manis pentadactyla TaxID=143292 RepID=UPI00255C941A|nr:zygote arrest protein 1 isoform X4 [Manis pentadactyla]